MDYVVKIWDLSAGHLRKEIIYSSQDEIKAMQQASAATPDGCRSTYEVINKEHYEKEKTETKEKSKDQNQDFWEEKNKGY